jgi:hypothetical protein
MALTIDRESFKSPNYDRDIRTGRPISMQPRGIVLHSGEGSRASDLGWLCNPASKAGAHYYVCRDGMVYGLMPDTHQAWHAGDSLLAGVTDWNSLALGVELEHTKDKHRDYPLPQMTALRQLCRALIARYNIQPAFIQSHRAIAAHRRTNLRFDPRDWDESQLRLWVKDLYYPPIAPPSISRAYRVRGVPIYQRSDGTGPLAGFLHVDEEIVIDATYPAGTGHLKDGRGFVDLDALEPMP